MRRASTLWVGRGLFAPCDHPVRPARWPARAGWPPRDRRGAGRACLRGPDELMTFRPSPLRFALVTLAALAPGAAFAQGPVKKVPAGVAEAQDEFDAALRSLEI